MRTLRCWHTVAKLATLVRLARLGFRFWFRFILGFWFRFRLRFWFRLRFRLWFRFRFWFRFDTATA